MTADAGLGQRLVAGRQPLAAIRAHLPFVAVLSAGALVRFVYWVVYWPGLMFSDSWTYLAVAFQNKVVGLSSDRPSGYPAILRILSVASRRIELFTAAQHLAGLAVGVLVYHLLCRLGVRRWLSTVAAAFVIFDAYTITLEQFILSEAFFALALVLSAYLVILWRRHTWAVVASGVLLAGATLIRAAGMVAVPVWLAYVVWTADRERERRWRTAGLALASAALPLLAYSSVHAAVGRGFGLTEADGWWLYARVAPIADCRGARVPAETRALCRGLPKPEAEELTAGHYVWDRRSPARQLFPEGPSRDSNEALRRFAVANIRAKPLAYTRLVATDMPRYFAPSGGGLEAALHLPSRGEPDPERSAPFPTEVRDRWFPDYRRPEPADDNIALRYQHWLRTPRLVLGVLAVLPVVALALPVVTRRRVSIRHHRELFLLSGSVLVMLVFSVAALGMAVRYLVPLEPLVITAGTLAVSDLLWARRGRDPHAEPARASAVPTREDI